MSGILARERRSLIAARTAHLDKTFRESRPPEVADILVEAARKYATSPGEILSKTQMSHVVTARTYAIQRLRQTRRFSMSAIGRYLGGLHHATVHHALNKPSLLTKVEPYDYDKPDESGIWAI